MTRSRFARLNDEEPYPPPLSLSRLEREIQSWEGFPWALNKDDAKLWNTMIKDVREQFAKAIEASGKDFTVEPFLMALLLAQQRIIKRLQAELRIVGGKVLNTEVGSDKLDANVAYE